MTHVWQNSSFLPYLSEFFVVCQVLYAKAVGATLAEGFLVL